MSALLIIALFAAVLVGALFAGALWLRQEFQKASTETLRSSQNQFLQQATATAISHRSERRDGSISPRRTSSSSWRRCATR